ncbi:relaxase/mobilization nuclease domain-containing protein [Commensalibacter intestini]|uniref:relaxase/mobilization nuclease domain-containing protein n=1 Tax=Commensalibacter intestini TaxID=479936 RepID=UPI000A3C9FB9|nr:relaxase/mobilization nuclease domain-containing protein [Commensalibacter intestini]
MLIKFFKRPPKRTNGGKGGNPKASMDYLLNKPEGEFRILQGNPELSGGLAEAMESANPYTVGCLSFEEANILEEDKKAIMQRFEESFLAGLDAEQYNICWIEHTDKGRLELNFFVPNVELSTGKRLNLYYDRADRHLAESFKKAINLEYGLTSPDDPQKRQTVSIDKSLPKNTKDAVAALNGLIEHEFSQGNIQNRQDVIACFEKHGFKISRQGQDYLSIKNENGRNVRLKGAFYEQAFRADTTRQAIAEAERGGSRESHRGEVEQAREQLQRSVKAKLRENRQRFEKPGRESKSKIAQAIQNTNALCRGDRNSFGVGSVISGLSSERLLGRDEQVEAFGGAIQSQQSEHGVQQMHDGRQDDQNMHSSGPTIQRPRVGKQYESFNDKGGLNEPDYEAVARGIERVKRDRQERFARYYRAAQEEYERRRAEARNRIEANQRAIEQVRDRKSGIKELAQKLFERVRITVQKKVEQYQERLQNNRGIGL